MKSISEDLVAALEDFSDVPPAMMRTLRYMKSCVYEDSVRPVYSLVWEELIQGLQAAGGPAVYVPQYVFGDLDETH